MALPFSDDFDRADSGTVGNGWSESESSNGIAQISSNKLSITSDNNSGNGANVSRSPENGSNNIQIRFNFVEASVGPITLIVGVLGDGAFGSNWESAIGYGFRHDGSSGEFQLLDSDTSGSHDTAHELDDVSEASVGYTAGETWEVEIRIESNNAMEIRLWETSDSRPTSATLSTGARTPDATGSDWFIYAGINDQHEYQVDNYEVTSLGGGATTPTPTLNLLGVG